jgi:SAM-dependent MidA family methyltransferase
MDFPTDISAALGARIQADLQVHDGWIGFDVFMAHALYAPGLGYYTQGATQFGTLPQSSDFVTAPAMTPLFGQALARQVAQALQATGTDALWEFGAGTGMLALQLLDALAALGVAVRHYTIVDLSSTLKELQRTTLQAHAHTVHWASELPVTLSGVVVGNEVLDAMPVQLLARMSAVWPWCLVINPAIPQALLPWGGKIAPPLCAPRWKCPASMTT